MPPTQVWKQQPALHLNCLSCNLCLGQHGSINDDRHGCMRTGPAGQSAELKAMIASLKTKAARAGRQPRLQQGGGTKKGEKKGLGKLEA